MWFFKKRKDKLEEIENKLNKSFLHIKNDMSYILEKISEHENQLNLVKDMLSTTEILASTNEQDSSKVFDSEENYSLKNTYETLTNTHKALLFKLGLLLKESPGHWIPMKVLSRELYPSKGYEKVKSMISNYTDNLLNLGFIQKKRIGRQIVITLTGKGLECLPQAIKQKRAQNKEK